MKTNNLKNILKTILFSLSVFLIEINNSFAEDNLLVSGSKNFKTTVNSFTDNVLTSVTTLLMTGAFVLFFYGIARFIYDRSNGDDTRLEKDKEAMLWGLIALFVMVSTWGIIKLFQDYLGIQGDNNIKVQSVQFLSPSSADTAVDPKGKLAVDKGDFSDPKIKISIGTSIPSDTLDLINSNLQSYNCFPLGLNTLGTVYKDEDTFMIKEFQRANKLSVTGIIDANTWKAFDSSANKCDYSKTLIKPPTQSPAINALFYYLKYYKCTNGKDAINYGTTYDDSGDPNTSDITYTENFQKANGLKVDGVVGEDTWKKLMSGTAKNCQ